VEFEGRERLRLLALEKQILFSTDLDGRIYGLAPDRRVTLVTQTNEGQTTRLLPSDHSILAATANMGRIIRLGDTPARPASTKHRCMMPAPPLAGQLELARRPTGGLCARVPHPLRQRGQARSYLERLVRSVAGPVRIAHNEPQRPLCAMENRDVRRRRRHAGDQ